MKRILTILLCAVLLVQGFIPYAKAAQEPDVQSNIRPAPVAEDEADWEVTEVADEPTEQAARPDALPETDADGAQRQAVQKAAEAKGADISEPTEEEIAAQAESSWDASAAQDGSVTVYLVADSAVSKTLYVFGSGTMADYTNSSRPGWDNADTEATVTAIYVADGVTNIGAYAFAYMYKSAQLHLPNTLTTLRKAAFAYNKSLLEVVLPESLTEIGWAIFNYCEQMKKAVYPGSMPYIARQCFQHCHSLEDFSFSSESQATEIQTGAFNQCRSLKPFDLPKSVTSLGEYAFFWCDGITDIEIPASVSLDYRSFASSKIQSLKWCWDGAYEIENSYVHEGFSEYYQGSQSWCLPCAAGTALNAIKHENDTDSEALYADYHQYYVDNHASLGAPSDSYWSVMTSYLQNSKKVQVEAYSYSSEATDLPKIIDYLQQGYIVILGVAGGVVTSTQGHVVMLYGIDEDGYFYFSDPITDGLDTGKYDIYYFTRAYHPICYAAIKAPTDSSIQSDDKLDTGVTLPALPEEETPSLPEGAKAGQNNETGNTWLDKSAAWTDAGTAKAEVTLDFSYTADGTDYIYILDNSETMTASTIDENYTNMSVANTLTYRAIKQQLEGNYNSRVALVQFNDDATASSTDFTTDSSVIYNAIDSQLCQGRTGYAYGLQAAYDLLQSRTGEDANRPAVVIFITDGSENMWIADQDSTGVYGGTEAELLRQAGATVYSVVLNKAPSESAVANMAAIAGEDSRALTAATPEAFSTRLVQIVQEEELHTFVLTDVIGEAFLYGGTLTAPEGTAAVIDEAQRTVTWTLENIQPNTTYTLTIPVQTRRDSSGQYLHGDLATNLGTAVVEENGVPVNAVESPILSRAAILEALTAQAHMVHKYVDLQREDNRALRTNGIRFNMELNMAELQAALEPGDQVAFATMMTPLKKVQAGDTTNYLTMEVSSDGKITSNGTYTFVNHSTAISRSKALSANTMITWTEAMDTCTDTAVFARLLKNAGMSIFEVTESGVRYSVYMMFSNASRQRQADTEIAYRGVMITYRAEDGYSLQFSYQRNNSATRIFNHYNYTKYHVINVAGATTEDMLHGISDYSPDYDIQAAALK
ncbi:MAG: leucine-rich repeat protein [Candidatus Faecousia sp.]|nr:leucine-rich repeat protein [Candidatus Faecousia sp.]